MKRLSFLFQGRMNRLRYFLWSLPIGSIAYLMEAPLEQAQDMTTVFLIGFVGAVILTAAFSIIIRRAHDLDLSGWVSLLLFIPLVNLLLGLYLLFRRGTPGVNRYGPDPLQN